MSGSTYGKRSWIVADAGGNDLLKVNRHGKVSTIAVLPAQPLRSPPRLRQHSDCPTALVGLTYKFEAVPTDVEVGRDGYLYVTTLAGGPESPVLGARSSVYRVNPRNGQVNSSPPASAAPPTWPCIAARSTWRSSTPARSR